MSILNNESQFLVGHIKTKDTEEDLGSCIPCKKGDEFFIITCKHVLYEDNWIDLRHQLSYIKVVVSGEDYFFEEQISDKDTSQKTDLAIVKIDTKNIKKTPPFIEIDYFEIQDKTFLTNSKICIFPQRDQHQTLVKILDYYPSEKDFIYKVEVDKNIFYDINLGAAGAHHYKGVSGSGLFLEHNGKIYLQGIFKSILSNTASTIIEQVNSKAINLIWKNLKIINNLEKKHPNLHFNSPFNSSNSSKQLSGILSNLVSNKHYTAFICAPCDVSSTAKSSEIFIQVTTKLKAAGVLYSVGGGKVDIDENNLYPHIIEQNQITSEECKALIVIADDHSTFSQLSLLSQSIFKNKNHSVDMYIFYKDEVIDSQIFMRVGPFKFAKEQAKAKVYKFSTITDSCIDEIVKNIVIHRTCLARIT